MMMENDESWTSNHSDNTDTSSFSYSCRENMDDGSSCSLNNDNDNNDNTAAAAAAASRQPHHPSRRKRRRRRREQRRRGQGNPTTTGNGTSSPTLLDGLVEIAANDDSTGATKKGYYYGCRKSIFMRCFLFVAVTMLVALQFVNLNATLRVTQFMRHLLLVETTSSTSSTSPPIVPAVEVVDEIHQSIQRIEEKIGGLVVAATATTAADTATDTATTSPPSPSQQRQQQQERQDRYQLQLQVPFYIYEESELNWINATRLNRRNHKWESIDQEARNYKEYKHSDDYWLLKAALEHPQRTLDASKAKLFFVPTLLNAWNQHNLWNESFCVPGVGCDGEIIARADTALKNSSWYQRHQGRDHIVVDSHYLKRAWWKVRHSALFNNVNIVQFEDRVPKSWQQLKQRRQQGAPERQQQYHCVAIPSMYVGRACPIQTHKTHDFAMIARFRPNNTDFIARENVCHWLNDKGSNNDNNDNNPRPEPKYKVSLCGRGKQCPALSTAKYGFHIRGDTWGANRLMDTLLSGSVPLFTNEKQLSILPKFVPWSDISYMINISTQHDMDLSLQELLSKSQEEYERKLSKIQQYMPLLDHTQIGQFDAYMTEFAIQLGMMNRTTRTTSTITICTTITTDSTTNAASEMNQSINNEDDDTNNERMTMMML